MHTLGIKILKNVQENIVVILLCMFFVFHLLSLVLVIRAEEENLRQDIQYKEEAVHSVVWPSLPEQVPKISEIKGPRIDDEAAMVVREERACSPEQTVRCSSLSGGVWVFLLMAFIGLLIFNLAFPFSRATRIQWGWELALTLLALAAWYIYDECRAFVWFPLYVLQFGILIFAIYLYFFERKKNREECEPGETESLF